MTLLFQVNKFKKGHLIAKINGRHCVIIMVRNRSAIYVKVQGLKI